MPKKTVTEIVESGNHYVIQVKGNQPTLEQAIVETFAHDTPTDSCIVEEKDRGSKKTWQVKVYPCTHTDLSKQWTALAIYVVLFKTEIKKGILTHTRHLYMSDNTTLSAQDFAKGIRGHWGIENRLHRVRDVDFVQDHNQISNQNAAVNIATFNTIAINFLRENIHPNISYAQILFGQNFKTNIDKFRN